MITVYKEVWQDFFDDSLDFYDVLVEGIEEGVWFQLVEQVT